MMRTPLIKVLLIDDDPEERLLIQPLLRAEEQVRYQLEQVADYDTARKRILQGHDDVYLVDYHLGAHDGIGLIEEMTALGCTRPLLLLTHQDSLSIDQQAMLKGAADYLPKGELSAPLLTRAIQHALERKRHERLLRTMAMHDALTGLLNRTGVYDYLEHALARCQRDDRQLAVMFIDLDRFKEINDTLGHRVGDALLIGIAHRLKCALRVQDMVARIGGDEFLVVAEGYQRKQTPAHIAEKILMALREPFPLEGKPYFVTCSIGIATYPDGPAEAETLIRDADTALYSAKDSGKNTYHFFTEAMQQSIRERRDIHNHLLQAMQQDEFELYYQPQFALGTGEVVALEVMLRWRHPQQGLLQPEAFLGHAEELGLMQPLLEWTLQSLAQFQAQLPKSLQTSLRYGINLSGRLLLRDPLVELLQQWCDRSGILPQQLELEISEEALLELHRKQDRRPLRLQQAGFGLVLDHFGTGYASFGQLQHYPICGIKVDRECTRQLLDNEVVRAVVEATRHVAHSLQLHAAACGVETPAQLMLLRELGFDRVQGQLPHPPRPAAHMQEQLQHTLRLR
ncbi:putative bifunctional diguanylate cyclase/phosphodiesterase [Leeia sp.]|uniref:putative bifunctional diguanylate cyclase/phosphodiesterase n=1 Tax=Leeia sp. TaxID=2884678 RepID=UPI0035B303E1